MDPLALLSARGLLRATADVEVTPLAGGYWNDVMRLTGDGRDWVVKVFAAQDSWRLFPILPDDEARALDVLAGHSVAPEPVAYVPRVGEQPAVLVYQWVDGAMWQGDGVEEVARLFRRQHAVPAEGFRSVPTDARGIVEQGDRLLRDAAPADAEHLRAVRPTRNVLPAARRVLLHTDAGPGNVIVRADGSMRLIDWQCPALGDAAEDLFTFLSPAFQVLYGCPPLDEATQTAFLAAYDDRAVVARLAALGPALAYRMGAYCALRRCELEQTDPAAAARYARALSLSIADLTP